MKAVIIGALGQLGMDVSEIFDKNGHEVVRLDIDDVEISDIDSLVPVLTDIRQIFLSIQPLFTMLKNVKAIHTQPLM